MEVAHVRLCVEESKVDECTLWARAAGGNGMLCSCFTQLFTHHLLCCSQVQQAPAQTADSSKQAQDNYKGYEVTCHWSEMH